MREWYYKNKFASLLILIVITFVIHIGIYQLSFKLLIETLLFAFIAFVFFDCVANVTTKKELFENIFKMMKNHHENIEMGFERVILNAETIEYKKLIKESSEIYICQIYGRRWLENYRRTLIERINTDTNVKINFLIYSSTNPSIPGLANLFTNGDEQSLKNKIDDSKSICEEIKRTSPHQVTITEVSDIPLFGALYVFDKISIHIPLSISRENDPNFIAYEFEDSDNQKNGYKIIKSQIEELLS